MKKIIILLAFTTILLTSCNDGNNSLEYNTLMVLKGEEKTDIDGKKYYKLYIFDGDESYWVKTSKKIYDSIQLNVEYPHYEIK